MKINQEWKDAIVHLRIHFSLLLMPVFFFAVSQSFHQPIEEILVMFLLLHLLVYPASNAYNSFHDNDSTSVGGLKSPPHINAKVLLLANLFDILCLSITIAIMGFGLFLLLLAYIITSRAYSHRKIRLKKYPYIGFLVIFIFQGAFTYYLSSAGIGQYWGKPCSSIGWKSYMSFFDYHLFALSATSFQIGAIYPLTQIYQHESDIADGVTTLSYKLGYKGTFIFSAVFFAIATTFYFLHFKEKDIESFYLLMIAQAPIVLYFLYWAYKVWKDIKHADYKHTMTMNVVSAVCLNLLFLYLIIK